MARFTLNGAEADIEAPADMPLLWAIRDLAGLNGTKFGCGAGICGACTVHVDGEAQRSCMTTLGEVEGRAVVTIEGLDPDGNHPVQVAWREPQRAAMRLLPGRADHAGLGTARRDAEPDRPGNLRRDARQHLPLRLLPADRRRRPCRRNGDLSHDQHPRACRRAAGRIRPPYPARRSGDAPPRLPAGRRLRARRGGDAGRGLRALQDRRRGHAARPRHRPAGLRRHRPGRDGDAGRAPRRDGDRARAPACRWCSPTRWAPTGSG